VCIDVAVDREVPEPAGGERAGPVHRETVAPEPLRAQPRPAEDGVFAAPGGDQQVAEAVAVDAAGGDRSSAPSARSSVPPTLRTRLTTVGCWL
jgi:hypothetical protein